MRRVTNHVCRAIYGCPRQRSYQVFRSTCWHGAIQNAINLGVGPQAGSFQARMILRTLPSGSLTMRHSLSKIMVLLF